MWPDEVFFMYNNNIAFYYFIELLSSLVSQWNDEKTRTAKKRKPHESSNLTKIRDFKAIDGERGRGLTEVSS